ncbi:hypothetical protein T01_3492 [Trichinella spiralis]|uniref:Uncharacterized protein n=1 Tax=Trichinella spiralis TaxID=6334 RepID=A0A0V1AY81_TRISP|nr:hypothetical protein T01_3492 [Trichinella spiralis]
MTESNENEKVCDALESIEQQITDKEAKDYLMKQKAIVQNIRASDDILTERQATMQTLIEHQEQINSKMAETYYLLKDKKKHLKMELASLKKEISSRKDAFEHNVNSTVDHVDQLRCARKGLQFAVKYKEKLDAAKEINGKINALKDEIMEQKNYLEQLNISHDKLSAEMANCENCDQDIVVQGQCEQQELGNCDAVDDDNLSVSENGSFEYIFGRKRCTAVDGISKRRQHLHWQCSGGAVMRRIFVLKNVTVAKNVDLLEMMATPIAGLSIEENENTQTESELSFVYTNNMQNMSTNFSNFGNQGSRFFHI